MAQNFSKPTQVVWLSMDDVMKIAKKYIEVKYGLKNTSFDVYDTRGSESHNKKSTDCLTVSFSTPISFDDSEIEQVTDEIKDRKLDPEL